MALRDAMISLVDGETPEQFVARALDASATAGGSGRLRLEVGWAVVLSPREDGRQGERPEVYCQLWVERGVGTSESWQKVTPSVLGPSYVDVLAAFGRGMDASQAAVDSALQQMAAGNGNTYEVVGPVGDVELGSPVDPEAAAAAVLEQKVADFGDGVHQVDGQWVAKLDGAILGFGDKTQVDELFAAAAGADADS